MENVAEVFVKVGNKSNIILTNTKAKRAITLKELRSLVNKHPEFKLVILENINEHEYEETKSFIKEVERLNKHVYFYVPDNHNITCGLADELIYNIYLNTESLFKTINDETGLNISNDITLNITPLTGGEDIDEFDSAFDKSFSTDIEHLNKYKEVLQEDIELPTISSKDDVADFFDIESAIEKITDTTSKEDITEVKKEEVEVKTDDAILSNYYSLVKERDSLKQQLNSALDRIQHITELNEAILDEKNTIKNILDSYKDLEETEEDSSINEEEHNKLKEEISLLEGTINNYKKNLETIEKERNTLLNKIKELKNNEQTNVTIDELKNEIDTLRNNEAYLENVSNNLRKIVVYLTKEVNIHRVDSIDKAEKIQSLNEVIEQLNSSMNMKNTIIQNLNDKIKENEEKLSNYDTLNEQVSNLELQSKEQKDTIEQNNVELTELRGIASEVEERVELARNYAKQELDEKAREVLELNSQVELLTSKLTAKEIQYEDLVNTTGLDSTGAVTVLENSKMIEEINKNLREQIVALQGDMERIEKDRNSLQQNYKVIEEQNKQYKTSIRAMSASLTGSGSSTSIPAINYTGKGMIIPVFGSGSYGITTTAMSMATKLAAQSRVLYIDFDMVSPKADIWFKINPIVKNIPGYNMANNRATGLGLLVDKQIQYFLEHASKIITRAVNTKGGSVDYISGFYAKPDAVRLVTTDFTAFLNYCGNNYTYTIIDFGRLGSSDINDQIIKIIADIAYRNVAVTTSEKLEVRTFRLKINDNKINIDNVAWLLNMCTTTGLDASTKKLISPAQYGMVPLHMDMYGNTIDFNKERITRDKFQLFLDRIVFKQ